MNSNRKTAIIVGALFLTAIVTWLIGFTLIESNISGPDYLSTVYENKTQVVIGILFELINGAAIVGIAVMLFPILKKFNESIALWYIGLRVIEATVLLVGLISPLLLIAFSQEYIKAGAPAVSSFQTLGTFAIEWRSSSGQLVPIFVSLGGMMFSYLLYQSKLVPRAISIWGLIGYALLLTLGLLEIFGYSALVILGLPVGLFEIFLAIWLMVKGFNSSAVAAQSANTVKGQIKRAHPKVGRSVKRLQPGVEAKK